MSDPFLGCDLDLETDLDTNLEAQNHETAALLDARADWSSSRGDFDHHSPTNFHQRKRGEGASVCLSSLSEFGFNPSWDLSTMSGKLL